MCSIAMTHRFDGGPGEGVGPSHIDIEHQIDPLHRSLAHRGQGDGAGIVDQDVDSAEAIHSRGDRCLDQFIVANIHLDGERFTASILDHLRGLVNRSRQLWMRLVGLCRDHHLGPVTSGTQGDRTADSTTSSRDHHHLACQRRGWRRLRVQDAPPVADL